MNLTEYTLNKPGVIKEILENAVSAKLFEFGILPGTSFSIVTKASFNGPIFIQVGTSRIALRKEEALAILVE